VIGETIVDENNRGNTIAYFIATVETLKVIRWIPVSRDDNTIFNGATKAIPWHEIASGGSLNEGNKIIFHWWLARDSTVISSEINRNF